MRTTTLYTRVETFNPFLLTDAYKISHPDQYPDKTEFVVSNVTARTSRLPGVDKIVVFGIQYWIDRWLLQPFYEGFFNRDWEDVADELVTFFESYFGPEAVKMDRIKALHDLQYLPLRIKSLPEGTRCPIGVPFMTIENTHEDFGWLTNFVETLCQTTIWNPIVAATIAHQYRELMDDYAERTSSTPELVDFQAHNFSMRGMSSVESGITTDLGHVLSFKGSDTLIGNKIARLYYGAEGLVSCSVPATEHAVMCAGGRGDERETFRRLIADTYPAGIISIVSDTWNLWDVLTDIAPSLRKEIEARDGKVVFRPDSGNPVNIICGYDTLAFTGLVETAQKELTTNPDLQLSIDHYKAEALQCSDGWVRCSDGKRLSPEEVQGSVRLLEKHFGSTVNDKGYRELNPKVGVIYGDSITYDRAKAILSRLQAMGYASTNVVLGIGSYTYQYNTRDTFGIACKATWAQVNGVGHDIYKDPVTDDGTKKSACGLLRVDKVDGEYVLRQQVSLEDYMGGELRVVLHDSDFSRVAWSEVQENLQNAS